MSYDARKRVGLAFFGLASLRLPGLGIFMIMKIYFEQIKEN